MMSIDWPHGADDRIPKAMNAPQRLSPGAQLTPLALTAIDGSTLPVPGPTATHLQFRRFAGCPVCNLHLQSFAQAHARLRDAGVVTIALFHSDAETMRPYQGQLPFPCVADPDRRLYRTFGVERSLLAAAHPSVWWAAARGLVLAPSNPFAGGSQQTGLPADFLVDGDGVVAAVHYGAHANDQWTVDDVLRLSAELR